MYTHLNVIYAFYSADSNSLFVLTLSTRGQLVTASQHTRRSSVWVSERVVDDTLAVRSSGRTCYWVLEEVV